EREPAVCDVCAGELVPGAQETAGDDGGVVCPETAAPLPPRGCGGPLYLLSCIKPLDAFTSGAERLQSKLVQTFPSVRLENKVMSSNKSLIKYCNWGGVCSRSASTSAYDVG